MGRRVRQLFSCCEVTGDARQKERADKRDPTHLLSICSRSVVKRDRQSTLGVGPLPIRASFLATVLLLLPLPLLPLLPPPPPPPLVLSCACLAACKPGRAKS